MLAKGFQATSEEAGVGTPDTVIICVPTPLSAESAPDLSAVRAAAEMTGRLLRHGMLVVLDSTTYPGTTDEVLRPILETASGLTAGQDFWLAFSPERIDPGNTHYGIRNTPKVVGGQTPACTDAAMRFYGKLCDQVIRAKSAREAEMAKLLENTYRHVNIALVNEMAIFCHELGVDLWDAIRCAATKPFGFQPFYPGPGVGGHCIPIDPNYLSYKVRTLGYPFRFVELAQEINSRMPRYVVDRAAELLNSNAMALNGARVLLLGVTYKRDVADQREFEKARPHAQRAAELGGKDHGIGARILLGRILSAENKTAEAKAIFNSVIRDFPNDPATKDAKVALAALEKPAVVVAPAALAGDPRPLAPRSAAEDAARPVPAPPAVIRPWAPPDVDAKEYVVAPDVSCSTDQLVQRTQARTLKQVANFEKFLATEHIEHQDVDAYGNPGAVKAKDFTYLVFIRKTRKDSFFLDEERDGGENLSEFPTSLASRGLVGLGIFLFVPEYQNDVIYKCEGLGEWRGQAAWEIRFEQRGEVPSRLMNWKNNRGVFPVALKGRVWVAANTYDLLHIETDLREPIPQLELDRDHLIIDYGPVKFDHGKTSLWLPWYAELYMQLHGKRYHHRHTLTNYALFSVDTDHQVNAPRETP